MSETDADLQQELRYLREHAEACHDPAAKYDLLRCYLRGEPTDHGDCAVFAKLAALEAENERLREAREEVFYACFYHGDDYPDMDQIDFGKLSSALMTLRDATPAPQTPKGE